MFSSRRALLAPALVAAFLAACSSADTTTGAGTTGAALTTAEAQQAAGTVVNDMASETDGATATGSTGSLYLSAAASAGTGAALMDATSGSTAPWWLKACTPAPTVTVNGTTTTFVFTNCKLSRLVPPESVTRNGTVAVTAQAGLRKTVFTGYRIDWDRLSLLTGNREQSSETRDGTREVTRDDGSVLTRSTYGATNADPFTTVVVTADTATITHKRNWQTVFTADTAGQIVKDAPLPAGTLTITGNGSWQRVKNGVTKTATFQTQTAAGGVHYNPSCNASGPDFDSGSITFTATDKNGNTSVVTVTFTACGQYTVTKS